MNIGAVWAQAKGIPLAGQPAVTYVAGAAPAAPSACSAPQGSSFGAMLVVSLLATGIVLFIKGKVSASHEEDEAHVLANHLERVEYELAAQREDIALSRSLGSYPGDVHW